LDWLQSEYIVFVSECAHGRYSRAVLKLLNDPPEIFRTSYKVVSSFDLPHGWTAKLVVRTQPLSVKGAEEIISELNLPNENKTQLKEWLDKYSMERLNKAERAVKLHPQDSDLWIALAREYQETDNHIDSVSALEQAISLASDEDKAIFLQAANLYSNLGNFQKSTSLYQRVINIFPDDLIAHWGLAQTYEVQGLYDEGFFEYLTINQLISKDQIPQLGSEWIYTYKQSVINKIDTLLNIESPKQAYELTSTLLQGDILTEDEKTNLASSIANQLINQDESALAVNTLAYVLPDSQNSTTWVILGKAYNKEKKIDDAIAALKQALIYEPKSFWANHLLASIYAKQENWDLVIKFEGIAFSVSKKIDRQIKSGLLLVKAYENTGKRGKACSMIEQLKSLAPDDERIEKINKDLLCQN
jgi:tetratricopeptide (TPR) repeat protein